MNQGDRSHAVLDAACPERIFDYSVTEIYSRSYAEIEAFQREALALRFAALRPRISVLEKLAAEQSIVAIESLQDGAPLLFQHSVYKSYPLSFIEKNQFDRMTKWLAQLTAHDLSQADAKGCASIDEWLDVLDRDTPLRIMHSSGTSGKLSFIPRSTVEMPLYVKSVRLFFQGFGDEPNTSLDGYEESPTLYMSYRKGAMAHHRILDAEVDLLYGGNESMIRTLYPGRMSADVLSLGGRLQAAEAKGAIDRLRISPALAGRRDAFLKEQAEAPARIRDFFDQMVGELRGRRVTLLASLGQLLDLTIAGEESQTKGVFDPHSFIMGGGGFKGRVFPDDWEARVKNFLGIETFRQGYGMTEMAAPVPACPKGNYHLHPTFVPYVLDPKTGEPAPRSGTHKGRFGVIDLAVASHWGGFLTGDEVTLSFGDTPCGCGREGAYVHPQVRRYSQMEGGDDKITCAGAPQAHENALAYLTSMAE